MIVSFWAPKLSMVPNSHNSNFTANHFADRKCNMKMCLNLVAKKGWRDVIENRPVILILLRLNNLLRKKRKKMTKCVSYLTHSVPIP